MVTTVPSGQRRGDGPTRTCVGCRRRAAKGDLIRIVRGPDGDVRIDPGGKAPGRGTYVCPDGGCFRTAVRRGRLGRGLRTEIAAGTRERLERDFEQRYGSEGDR